MTDKATARPWKVGVDGRSVWQEEGDEAYIAALHDGPKQANARLIVKAVNAHEEMVQFLRDMATGAYHGGGQWEDEMRNAEDEARALLARIEGE